MNVWMYWDCPQCGVKHIRGDHRACPGCGRARGDDVRFYILDNEEPEEVSKEQENYQPDWYCEYCGSFNSSKFDACESCGSLRSESKRNYFTITSAVDDGKDEEGPNTVEPVSQPQSTNFSNCNSSGIVFTDHDNVKQIPIRSNPIFEWIGKHKGPLLIGTALAALVAAIIFLCVFLFVPYQKDITVSMFSWERSISIEELKTFDESGWSLPDGARLQRTSLEVRTYENVLDHYETKTRQVAKQRQNGYDEYVEYIDLGNGQAKKEVFKTPRYETYYETEEYQEPVYRKEPVYDTKYYYEIDRWTKTRSVNTAGAGTSKAPYWGEVVLRDKEREGNRVESYYVHSEDGDQYQTDYWYWEKMELGSSFTVSIRRFDNKITDVDFSE